MLRSRCNLRVAIRGGGHSSAGASSSKDGLVIDLSRQFNYAIVDPEKRTVRVRAGTLWSTVEKETIQHGLATVAGSVDHRNYGCHDSCHSQAPPWGRFRLSHWPAWPRYR
jgi:hypothetical protein